MGARRPPKDEAPPERQPSSGNSSSTTTTIRSAAPSSSFSSRSPLPNVQTLALVLFALTSLLELAAAQRPVDVRTPLGVVRGYESAFLGRHVHSFLGVPFGEPPVGTRRFLPPVPVRAWNGTLNASTLSKACYQGRDTYNTTFWGSEMWNANTPISEDCLTLNIWSPAVSGATKLTVMVWLFGGGYWYGSPSLLLYDGRSLAVTGNVVVVNINYRVGPFGYLYLGNEEAPGNMGMLDQQLALQWVRDNIAYFGGDPDSVTLFGESAGASSIVAHLIAPRSQGLFKRGILQSGSLDNAWSLDLPERALEKSLKLAELNGCYNGVSPTRDGSPPPAGPSQAQLRAVARCLRAVPAEQLTAQIWNIGLHFLEFPFVIVSKDPNFFAGEDALVALRNNMFAKHVDLMIGINHDEGNFWNIYNLASYFDKQEQPRLSRDEFHECVDTAFAVMPPIVRSAAKFVYGDPNCTTPSARTQFYAEQVNQMVGDYFFTCDSIWLADQFERAPAKIYIYYFDQPSSANPWPVWTGVMHGYEIEYVFGVPVHNESAGYSLEEREFSKQVIKYWTSFATSGVPHLAGARSGELKWPAYHGGGQRRWMYLRAGDMHPVETRKQVECALWRDARDHEYFKYLAQLASASAVRATGPLMLVTLLFLVARSPKT